MSKCDCRSHSWEIGTVPAKICTPLKSADARSIDFCIADTLQRLWDAGIVTLNSCCGHNRQPPSVVLEATYNEDDIEDIFVLIAQEDDRKWDILQWQQIQYSKPGKKLKRERTR